MIVLASLVIAGVFVVIIPSAFSFFIINGVPVVHAQSIFPVPPPPTSQPGTTSSISQPCTNTATNIQGSHDNKATQTQNLENRCSVNVLATLSTITGTCPTGFVLQNGFCVPSTTQTAPIANAGPSQTVSQGSLVTLDGTGSHAATSGATIVSYSWVQTSATSVTLTGANTATPSFTAPQQSTVLSFSLTVTDSTGVVSSPALL